MHSSIKLRRSSHKIHTKQINLHRLSISPFSSFFPDSNNSIVFLQRLFSIRQYYSLQQKCIWCTPYTHTYTCIRTKRKKDAALISQCISNRLERLRSAHEAQNHLCFSQNQHDNDNIRQKKSPGAPYPPTSLPRCLSVTQSIHSLSCI